MKINKRNRAKTLAEFERIFRIQETINVLNMVPANITMLPWVETFRATEKELEKTLPGSENSVLRIDKCYAMTLEKCLTGLPQHFINYVLGSDNTLGPNIYEHPREEAMDVFFNFLRKTNRYADFEGDRTEVVNLIRAFELQNSYLDSHPEIISDEIAQSVLKVTSDSYFISTTWSISPKTREFSYKTVGSIGHFKGIDSRLLKICPECHLIFFAKRLDQNACSKKCSRNYRVHKFREKERQEKKRKDAHFESRVKKDEDV